MRRSRVFVLVVIGLVVAAAVSANVAQAISTTVVISEFRVRGPNGGSDEFVELYNLSSSSVNIGGWKIRGSNSSGAVSTRATIPSGVTLNPGCHYLFTNSSTSGGPYSGPVLGDQTYATGITDDGGIAVTLPDDTVVDMVGMSAGSAYKEGTPLASLGSSNLNRGYERKLGGTAGSGTDTDNNSSDFQLITPSNPQNLSSPCIALSTSPTGVGAANPDPVTAGNSTLLTVSVTPGTSPASTGLAVTGDLTSIGGSATQSFFDDGTNGDVTAGDNVFSLLAAVPGATAAGGKSLPVSITDAQARSGNTTISLTVQAANVCTQSYTPAYAIQGSGPAAAITGVVTTQGVVVGDYEGPSPTLRGFYLQDVTGDGNPATSDGIFVFNGNNNNVSLGDVVRVTGSAGEFQDQTQISSVTSIANCGTASAAPVDVTLPVPSATYLEQFEGMLVRFPQTLYVTEHFQLGRFGQVVMSSGGRLSQPTSVAAPGTSALALQAANNLNRIIVDDDLQNQNPDPIFFGRGGNPLSASNTLRGGDTAANMVGVLTYTWAGNAASGNAFRLRPLTALGGGVPDFQPANPRPSAPGAVGGSLRVASMNLLNFFNTFGLGACTNGVGGSATDCRGADNLAEFDRQWPKTVAAILAVDPDVLGVNEVENDGYGPASAIQFLVDKLNAATAPGTYAFVDFDAATGQPNALGVDAIKVNLIYKPASVTPVGTTAVLNSTAFVNGGDTVQRNRATFAQAFEQPNGANFVVSVNHLKSKGSACDAPDAGDGQGNCNIVRTNAANTLAAWLATDPTGTDESDILIIGDLNSYAKEDPVAALESAGYTNLIAGLLGADAYSFVFDGQWGYLDHALASSTLVSQVTGVTEYHVNADEPSVLDYNTNFKSAGQIASLYAPDQFRSSDHDPVIVGLNLTPEDTTLDVTGTFYDDNGAPTPLTAKLSGGSACDVSGKTIAFYVDLNEDGSFTDAPDELVGTGVTNGSGNAQFSWSGSSAPGWAPGIWDVQAVFAGGPNCDPSDDTSTIAIVLPGDAANGGGWYQYKTTGSPRVNFAFTVKKQKDGSYKGQLLWHNNEKWRLKGTLTSFGKTACSYGGTSGLKCGSSQGIGKLYSWNATTLAWDHVQDVSFVINFVDGGSSKKGGTKPDFFGINVTDFADPALPESAPQSLKGGNVQIP